MAAEDNLSKQQWEQLPTTHQGSGKHE